MASSLFDSHDWYDTPAYYDIVFDGGTAQETQFLVDVLHKYGPAGGRRVLEPACGSGRLVEAMTARGYQVTGFDQNLEMVAYTQARMRTKRPTAKITTGDMANFAYDKPFALAHCLVSTFKYLLDEKSAVGHLQCMSGALAVGGVYVLGFHLSDYTQTTRMRERWFGSAGNTHVICNTQTWPPDKKTRLERVRSRLTVRQGRKRQALETNWPFRTYDAAQVRRMLAKVPTLELVDTYDFGYELSEPRALDDSQLDCVLILRRCA